MKRLLLTASAAMIFLSGIATAQEKNHDLSQLNGKWTLQTFCGQYLGHSRGLVINAGKLEGQIEFGVDALYIVGQVKADGSIDAYATGQHVDGTLTGSITDWKTGKAKGPMEAVGEVNCFGTYTMTKVK